MSRDLYEVLGVDRRASQEEIHRAYRRLARRYHPDISSAPDAEDRFKELNDAYTVLSDPTTRGLYDRHAHGWRQARPQPQQHGQSDDRMWGGSARRVRVRTASRPNRDDHQHGYDTELEFALTVDDAYTGGKRRVIVTGDGADRSYEVTFPAGVMDGTRIRVAGLGQPGRRGGPDGDLYLVVRLSPHPQFRVDRRDVSVDMDVAPWEAALGSKIALALPGGPVDVVIPAGSSSGSRIQLPSCGLPNPNGASGDLHVTIRIVVPKQLTAVETRLFRRLAERSRFDPRAAPADNTSTGSG